MTMQKISLRCGLVNTKSTRTRFLPILTACFLLLNGFAGAQTGAGLGVERLDSYGTYTGFWHVLTTSGFLYSDNVFVPGSGANTLVGGSNAGDNTEGGFLQLRAYYTGFVWENLSLYQTAFPWATFTPSPSNGPGLFGQWKIGFKNGGGGADNIPPAGTITNPPVNGTIVGTPSITVSGTASDNVGVTAVYVRATSGTNTTVNPGPWVKAGGTTSWTTTMPLTLGINTIEVYPVDAAANSPIISSRTVTYALPQIVVEQPAGNNLEGPLGVIFQPLTVGSSATLTFTVKNLGVADLTGLGITIGGTNSSEFTVTQLPVAPVHGPNGSTTFVVRFSPSSPGRKDANLSIVSNDAIRTPYYLSLNGNGEAPKFDMYGRVITAVGRQDDYGEGMAVQSDGKIVVAGTSISPSWGTNSAFSVVRYNGDGSLDATFNGIGMVTTALTVNSDEDRAHSVKLQTDGKIVISGSSNHAFAVLRCNANGSLDTSFNGTGKVITSIGDRFAFGNSLALQSDGKIVVAGESFNVSSPASFAVVRYNTNGSLDTSFNSTGKVTTSIGSANDIGNSVAIQIDGKIVVAGQSGITTGGSSRFAVVRYNANGSLDTTFNGTGKVTTVLGTGNDIAYSVAIQSDGRIVVAGKTQISGNYRFAVVRYNADGSLDTTFNGTGKVITSLGTSSEGARSVTLQSDGKIVVAGSSFNGTYDDFALARYNRSNGSLDHTFNGTGTVTSAIGSGSSVGNSVAIQSDGTILVAGQETGIGEPAAFALARYFKDGSSINYTISPSASPSAGGTVGGGGTFAPNTSQTVTATAKIGYTFANWTENGTVVSTSPSYPFTLNADRVLVANFTPGLFTIVTSGSPVASGSTFGGGTFNYGASVTVLATPNGGYDFVKWTEGGSQVSASASYNFTVSASRNLVANFALSSNASLASLVPSAGTLAPVFASGTTTYTATVALSSITVTPAVTRAGATVTVNGTAVTSGTASGPIALNVGVNPAITIIVTAPDGVTKQSYTLTVTRRKGLTDLNNDGNADLVFQSSLGQIAAWYMNGAGVNTSAVYLTTSALGDWKVKGVADMNGDGNTDIIFQNNAGQIVVWYLDGAGVKTSSGYLSTNALGDWGVVGVADMNNDGNADVIFQNNAGQLVVWYRNSSGAVTSSVYLTTLALGDWRVVGVADMNNDGNADLIFQNTTGQVFAWYMDGAGTKTASGYLNTGALGDWRVVGVADMNNDGNADLIFQNTIGQIVAWYMNGAGTKTSSGYLSIGGLGDWRVR